ncbi:MAG: ribosome biogenesis GTPase Der [Alphaproteobacteria bacterium]
MTIKQKVALIGRPNVGKSTLFNRLVGRRVAIVHDEPGVTRDRREGAADLLGLSFTAIDTAGLADPSQSHLMPAMIQQTRVAITQADVILFLLDGRDGVTAFDEELAGLLRQQNKPVIVVVNKCEGRGHFPGMSEAYRLGFAEVLTISAEHGEGMSELCDALATLIKAEEEPLIEEQRSQPHKKPLQLAIVGRPNAGKSTLVNYFLGEERVLTGDEPGVTRDAIGLDWVYKERALHIVDTAGLRRRARVNTQVEYLATQDTHRIICFAEVVILVVDALIPLEKQDLTIASDVIAEGRALVVAVNKIDQIAKPKVLLKALEEHLETHLAQAKSVVCLGISAKNGRNCHALMDAVLEVEQLWNKRLPTAKLNQWLAEITQAHPPPLVKGRRIRLKYMTQVKARPPTFAVFATQAEALPDTYERYLVNRLRQDFDLPGIPLRLHIRKIKNPYATVQ